MVRPFKITVIILLLTAAVTKPPADAANAKTGRDITTVAAVIENHRQELIEIYNTYLEAGLAVEGKVVVRFTIAPTGVVTASEVAEGTTDCPLFEEAVAAAVRRWDFGPGAGEPVTVIYPFVFSLPDK